MTKMKLADAPNFLPDDYLRRRRRRREMVLCASLFVAVLSAVGAAYWISGRSLRDVQQRDATMEREYCEVAARIERVRQMREQQADVVQHAELAASLLEKVPRSNILAEVTNSMPAGLWLQDFSLDSSPCIHLKLTGVAGNEVQVARFITRLNQSRILRDVDLLTSDAYQEQRQTLRRFRIEMTVDPEAEVRDDPALAQTAAAETK